MVLWRLKVKMSLRATWTVLRQWEYGVSAVGVAEGFFLFLYWSLNFNLLWFLITARRLTLGDKLHVILGSPVDGVLQSGLIQGVATVALVVLQGVVISVLIYSLRRQASASRKAVGGSFLASAAALLGVGCVSCGTSIIAPIASLFVAGATAEVGQRIHDALIYVALLAVVYALYTSGATAARTLALEQAKAPAPE
jgi:hypothetical protein